jgi:TRAP-type C4-dicarboxylate transport system permease small subunit
MREAYLHFCDGLVAVAQFAVKVLMAAMTVDVLLGVFFRYIIGDALTWTEEVGRYLLIWMGYLAAGLALREGNHVAVDVISIVLSGRTKQVVTIVARVLSLSFLLTVVGLGLMLLPRLKSRSAALAISMFWPYLAVPIGCLLTAFEMVALLIRDLQDRRNGNCSDTYGAQKEVV